MEWHLRAAGAHSGGGHTDRGGGLHFAAGSAAGRRRGIHAPVAGVEGRRDCRPRHRAKYEGPLGL